MTARTPGQDPVSAPSAADVDHSAAVTAAVVDGSVLTPGAPLRTAVFDAVRADRDGPVTHELIGLTGHHRPAVRRTALTLLTELAFNGPPSWQGPIPPRPRHPHRPGRRTPVPPAAHPLPARAAPAALTPHLAALVRTAPPALRDLAVDTLCASRTATRLAADDLAALLPTTHHPRSDTAWTVTYALATVDDPRAAPSVHARLASGAPPAGAVAAVRGLLRSGTADADQLAPVIRQLLRSGDSLSVLTATAMSDDLGPAAAACVPELIEALRTECALRDAQGTEWATRRELRLVTALGRIGAPARAAVPLLERLTRESRQRAGYRALALSRITGERHFIESALRSPSRLRQYVPDRSALFEWLLDHGGLTPEQSRQLRDLVFTRPSGMQVFGARAVWRNEGPAAAGELLAVLPQYLGDDLFGPVVMATLAAMGEHARPALPQLRALIDRRTRLPHHAGSDDADMNADEQLLEAARQTVAAVTA
ncbi:hypothetical protein XF35_27850 [Streptomyces platensis subsp. clarensis]|nr:hypothetical protein [Streptomyces platensis subsp. clarensis]